MVGPEFASCWLKIGRAEEHFQAFQTEHDAWVDTSPYQVVRKRNADGSRHSLLAEVNNPPPLDRWSLIAGDCVHNLRSALDHLAYALAAHKIGEAPPNPRSLQFPI